MTKMYASAKGQRTMLWIAAILATIYSFAYAYLCEFFPPPSPTLGFDQVVAVYAHANLKFQIGVVLMIASGAFYFPWSVVIAIQMARDEKGVPMWAILLALASTMCGWTFVLPAIFWGVAAFTVSRTPELTMLMNELGWLCFITPTSFFPFQLIPVAAIAFSPHKDKNSAFPRWLGWLSIWAAIGGSLGVVAMIFKIGPFAWNGIIPFYLPLFVFFLWVIAMAWCMWRAIGRQERTEQLLQSP